MNRGCHMSYQCRIVNTRGGSDIVRMRPWPGYMMPLQCLLYKEPKMEEQKNKSYSGRFPYLQGRLVPQAGYTTLFVRVDTHVHCCTAVILVEICPLVLDSAHVVLLLGPGRDCRHTGQLWPPQVFLY